LKETGSMRYHIILGFLMGAAFSCLLWSSPLLSKEALVMLVIFNFLFVSLTFPLEGMLAVKLFLLLGGDFVGFAWNYVLSQLVGAITSYFGEYVNTAYLLLSPFLNLVWIVSFWTLSLTALSKSKNIKVAAPA